jgi:hypothetical protein
MIKGNMGEGDANEIFDQYVPSQKAFPSRRVLLLLTGQMGLRKKKLLAMLRRHVHAIHYLHMMLSR